MHSAAPTADRAAPSALATRPSWTCTAYAGWTTAFWLRDLERPETLAYLRAERGFYEAQTAHTRPLRELLFAEMTHRTLSTDQSVRWTDQGSVYYTQTVAGKEYEQFFRRPRRKNLRPRCSWTRTSWRGRRRLGLLRPRRPRAEPGRPAARLLRRPRRRASTSRPGSATWAPARDLPDVLPRTYYGGAWSSRLLDVLLHDLRRGAPAAPGLAAPPRHARGRRRPRLRGPGRPVRAGRRGQQVRRVRRDPHLLQGQQRGVAGAPRTARRSRPGSSSRAARACCTPSPTRRARTATGCWSSPTTGRPSRG